MSSIKELEQVPSGLEDVFERVEKEGEILVRRLDGRIFAIREVSHSRSPLDVPRTPMGITTEEIVKIVRDGRERLWDSDLKRFVWPDEAEYAALVKDMDDTVNKN